jgi:hypothetical protein
MSGATIAAGSLYGLYGIQANTSNASNVSVTTSTGDIINSGGTGINSNSSATSAPSTSTISITAYGTINSGFDMNTGGGQPGGIWAGYNGGTGAYNSAVAGGVTIDSFATINAAAGAGVGIYNDGVGNVSLTLESTSAINAPFQAVSAFAQGGGNVTIVNKGIITSATGTGIATGTGSGLAGAGSGIVSITNTGTKDSQGNFASGIIDALGVSNGAGAITAVVQINNASTQGATFTNTGLVVASLYAAGSSQNMAVVDYYGGKAANIGAVTVTNSGTISGNVTLNSAPTSASTFQNQSSGVWNIRGINFFNGAGTISNFGIINIAGVSGLDTGGTLAITNSGTINVAAIGAAYIGGAVTGTGTFNIGDRAELEFATSVAAGQTVSFVDGSGLLTLDDPLNFHGTIRGLAIGDAIDFNGISVASAAINGSVLTVTETNNQTLTYQIAGALVGNTFSVLSGNEIILVPAGVVPLTGSSGPLSFASSAQQFYILSNKTISGGSAAGFNVTLNDSTSTDYLTVQINQASSISGLSGTFNGVNLTTTGANIALINAGTITSSGGIGINTSSGTGSTDIIDYGNVSGSTVGIDVHTNGALNIVVGGGATITGTTSTGILAISTLGVLDVSTLPGVTVNSGSSGIFAENQGSSVPSANNSSISISTAGSINSGSTGIVAAYLGGTSAPSSIPNPPLAGIFGNVTVDSTAMITASTGFGINAYTYGTGNVLVSNSGSITATAAGNTNGTGNPTNAQYGISASNYGAGNITVVDGSGSTITSGSVGIYASNAAVGAQATPVGTQTTPITVTVVAFGAITSGAYLMNGGNASGGVIANLDPGNISGYNGFVYGDILISAAGNSINAQAGDGIRAIDHGQGNVTINIGPNETITAQNTPTGASANLSPYGIQANAYGPGDITVTTSSGDVITTASTGINATNEATAIPATANALVTVNAAGKIISGNVETDSGSSPSGISAGFYNGGSLLPNVSGTVIVNNSATITVAGGRGVVGYSYGNGDVTVNDSGNVTVSGSAVRASSTATTTTEASEYGLQASANGGGTGNVAINVYSGATISATSTSATITNPVYGVFAFSSDSGNISVITNSGSSITSSGAGIDAVNEDSLVATLTATTNAATSISSPTLNFASTPSWIVSDMPVYDVTTGKSVGTVSSITGNTVTLTANATNAVGSGDTLSFAPIGAASAATSTSSPTLNFAATPSWIVTGMTVYDVTTGKTIGSVASTTGTTVTLTANAASAVGIGDALSFPETTMTTLATSTSSPTLNFAATPSWIVSGMTVYDVTTDRIIGTVSSTTGTMVTLAANAANAVASGDMLSFATSSIVVTSYSTISSGAVVTGTGSPPAGIIAGYLGGGAIPTAFPLTGVFGDVTVNNFGNITAAAGDGIRAFTYGIGNVTVNEDAGTIAALGGSSPTNGYGDGINASNRGPGDILVTTATGVVINSGSSGISALNYAPAPSTNTFSVPSTSDVTVIAHGTIISGTIPTLSGDPAAGILAGYNPGVTNTNQVDAVNANVAGNVLIDDYATITAAAGTDGIRGINYGTGAVTIITEIGADITGGRYGIGGFAYDGGNVSVTNYTYVTGSTAAIDALSTSTGTVFIDNYGVIAGDVVSSGNATFHNEAGAVWNPAGSSTFAATSALINDGIIDTTGVSSITTSSVLTIVNSGVLEVQSGSLDVGAAVTGFGTFTIHSGSLLEFAASVSAGSVVTFEGTTATLKLDHVAQFGGSVTGFAFGDTIDLVGVNPANVSVSNAGSLQISYGTGSMALGGQYNPADFTVGSDGLGGTDVTWNHQAPVISTSGLTVTQNGNGTTTISGLQVSDSDAAASTETFTITATTGAASSGAGVSPSTGSGLLTAVNTELGTGNTYNPGTTPPSTDKVTLSVTDGFGATDTVNFVFNFASNPSTPLTLTGTPGKDVILATGFNDVLTGGGGSDQFVFNQTTGSHTITDFSTINDHIDLTALSSIVTAATLNAWLASNAKASTTSPADTLISLGSSETITLHNVLATNVHASDFIVHA